MTVNHVLDAINSSRCLPILESLYGFEGVEEARRRYRALLEGMAHLPGAGPEVRIFTAAGRTELAGNHTDHNQGRVLAASIQLDAVAVATPRDDRIVFFRSTGYPDVVVDLADLSPRPEERGTTEALIRGIGAELTAQGTAVRGFSANGSSTVLSGSGLSSSAALEVLVSRIFDNLYGKGQRSALEIAKISQKAENLYFGKPCGLMDQTACASGGAVAIDFADAANPLVSVLPFDLEPARYILCVVNTRGNHADLTPDYAAIPAEMKEVAAFFGKPVLRELRSVDILAHIPELRQAAGDRAILRALHFFSENDRVDTMRHSLEQVNVFSDIRDQQGAMSQYLKLVNESGDSSWELLQNIYAPHDFRVQGISLALALSRNYLRGSGACRVHGGGFAGTIQAYIPRERLPGYREVLEGAFGEGAVTVLRIRSTGAAELNF